MKINLYSFILIERRSIWTQLKLIRVGNRVFTLTPHSEDLQVPLPSEVETISTVLRRFTWKPRPESGPDCLANTIARQRHRKLRRRVGGGKFIQNRLRSRFSLLKTTALRGKLTLGDPLLNSGVECITSAGHAAGPRCKALISSGRVRMINAWS